MQRRWWPLATVILMLSVAACHREVAMPPLPDRNITVTDRFFDVWPTSATRAFIVGARGKVLLTEDGGRTFERIDIGTDGGVFGIRMADDQNGYLCGQDGLIMRTRDGGRHWEKINSRTSLYIFSLSTPDRLNAYFVGDRSLVLSTSDGGESFVKRQLQKVFPEELRDYALPYEEPVLYGVDFVDAKNGWIAGELGRLWMTANGGQSWTEQQGSLLSQWKRPLGPSDDPRLADFLLPTLFSVSFRDRNNGAACGLEGWVIQTSDGGKTWRFAQQAAKPGDPPETLVPGEPRGPARDPLFSIDLFGRQNGMATGLTGTALTLQSNSAWARDPAVPPTPFPLSQVRFFDDMHGWIAGYGVIFYTEDGGKTWRMCQG